MPCTPATFRARFPEFSDPAEYPDPRIQLFLDDATLHIGTDENYWKGRYDIAHCYLAAHLLTVGSKTEGGATGSDVGPIKQKSVGGVSVTKSVVDKDRSEGDLFYSSTAYGQYFLTLRSMTFIGAQVAV